MAGTPAKIDPVKLIYGELPKDVAKTAKESVERIKEKIFKTGIEVGRELTSSKPRCRTVCSDACSGRHSARACATCNGTWPLHGSLKSTAST